MHKINACTDYRKTLRETILTTASELFEKNGIKAVKMDDIANSLSISKRTLYEIFIDKESLLLEAVKQHHRRQLKKMESFTVNHNVLEIILEIYRLQAEELNHVNPAFYTDLHRYKNVIKFMQREKLSNRDKSLKFFEKGIEEGYFRNDVKYDIIYDLSEVQMNFIMSTKFYLKYPFSDIYRNILLVTVRGFCTEKGFRTLESYLNKVE